MNKTTQDAIKKVKAIRWLCKTCDALVIKIVSRISEDTKTKATTEKKVQKTSTKLHKALKIFEQVNINQLFYPIFKQ